MNQNHTWIATTQIETPKLAPRPLQEPSGVQIHRLDPNDSYSWALMPQVLWRVYTFCQEIDTETEPIEVVDLVKGWFFLGDPREMAIWLFLRDTQVVGHLLITSEPFRQAKLRYTLIRQAKVDVGIAATEEAKQVFEQVKEWTKSLGLNKILMLTHRNDAAMMRKWKFEPHKALMKLILDD